MAKVKKSMKKYQMGGPVASKKKAAVDSVESEMFPGKMIPKSKSNYENGSNIATGKKSAPKKAAVPKKKMKSGGSFPDLNKDGKVTKKDILIGKGVLPKTAKKGAALKKQAAVAIAMKKAGKSPKKAMGGMKMMMGGGKCKYGC